MSASEMLIFTRYVGIIIGDEVPRDYKVGICISNYDKLLIY